MTILTCALILNKNNHEEVLNLRQRTDFPKNETSDKHAHIYKSFLLMLEC